MSGQDFTFLYWDETPKKKTIISDPSDEVESIESENDE